jgi:methyl-accepting chemotaxis protein
MKKIKTKLVLLLCLIVLISSGSLALLSYLNGSKILLNKVEEDLEVISIKSSQVITERINTDMKVLEQIASNEILSNPNITRQMKLKLLEEETARHDYQIMNLTDINGQSLASDGKTYDISNREYFQKAIKGETVISDIRASLKDNTLIIAYATPVIYNGRIVGVISSVKDARDFSAIISDISVGEKGFSFIIDNKGNLVAYKDIEKVLERINLLESGEKNKDKRYNTIINKMLDNENGKGQFSLNGVDNLIGYAPINNTTWSIGVVSPVSEALDKLTVMKYNGIVLTLMTILITYVFVYLIGQRVANPLNEIAKVINRFSRYDLHIDKNKKIEKYLDRKDEVGIIFVSLMTMQESLSNLIKQIRNVAVQLSNSSISMTDTTQEAANTSQEIVSTIEEIANGASNQAKSTELGSETATQLEKLIDEEYNYMEKVNENSRTVNELVDVGLIEINELLRRTEESGKSAKEICNVIHETNESSKKIGGVSSVIASIAAQTNLLALNAAIEAARAGEAGKGFVVVAEEIRSLAEQSTQSTKEIDNIVNELINNINNAVEKMQIVSDLSEEQSISVRETEKKYNEIANKINNSQESIHMLNSCGNKIKDKKIEIVDIIHSLSSVAQENAAGTEEATASTEEQTASIENIASTSQGLAELAQTLEELASRFQVE